MPLLPTDTLDVSNKIKLFDGFSDASFPICKEAQSWGNFDPTLYKNKCLRLLNREFQKVACKFAAVNKDDLDAIPLSEIIEEENTFSIKPSDPSTEFANGLAPDIYITEGAGTNVTMSIDSMLVSGNDVDIKFYGKVEYNDSYPAKSFEVFITLYFERDGNTRYDSRAAATVEIITTQLRRGPLVLDDVGENYYDVHSSYKSRTLSEISDNSHRLLRDDTNDPFVFNNTSTIYNMTYLIGSYIDLQDVSFTFDFEIDSPGQSSIETGDPVTVNSGTKFIPFSTSIFYPEGQYTEFPSTQSSTTTTLIEDIEKAIDDNEYKLKSELYEQTVGDNIDSAYDEVMGAIPYGDKLDKDEILTTIKHTITGNKTSGKAGLDNLNDIVKKGAAGAMVKGSVNSALADQGIYEVIPQNCTEDFLDMIATKLSLNDIEIKLPDGSFDYSNIPGVISLQEAAKTVTAIFGKIPSVDSLLENPCVQYINSEFDFISKDIKSLSKALDSVI